MRIGVMTIPNGGTVSDVIPRRVLQHLGALEIHTPAALTGTVSLQTPVDEAGSDFNTVESGGADVTLTANRVIPITDVPMLGLRVSSSLAEGAERAFVVNGSEKG